MSSFQDILGENINVFSEDQRKERWQQWNDFAKKNTDMIKYWNDASACNGCVYLDGNWCKSHSLPCTVNPVLSFKHAIKGMACMGAGKKESQTELTLDDDLF